jgi:hypothetical protein
LESDSHVVGGLRLQSHNEAEKGAARDQRGEVGRANKLDWATDHGLENTADLS